MRFVDSNVWLYAIMRGADAAKRARATTLIRAADLVISTQVVNETCFNLVRKAKFDGARIRKIVEAMYRRAAVLPVTRESILRAADLRDRYQLSFWDSHLAACALLGGCVSLESEDMQDGLVIDDVLTIRNPFKP